jgi:thioredoxin 1
MPPLGPFGRKDRGKAPPLEEWPKGTVELEERSFDDFISRYPLAAIEFWASWCAPCKAMRPVIRDMATRHRGAVAFGKVNIERHRKLAEANDVLSIPHIIFFSYGKRVGEFRGKMNRRRFEGKVRSLAKTYR